MEDEMFKRRTPWWREAHFEVKFPKHLGSGSLLGVEMCVKHSSKAKYVKNIAFGQPLEVEMLKKCTLLRREAHFEAKKYQVHHVRTTFGRSRHFLWPLEWILHFSWPLEWILHLMRAKRDQRCSEVKALIS